MLRKITVGGLSVFFVLALVGFASAEVETENDNWEYNLDSPAVIKENITAKNHVYDQEAFAIVGTEAGDWKFRPDAPETKADIAAKNYQYDQESLALIGTEAGDWEFKADNNSLDHMGHKANEAVADDGEIKDAVCKEC